MLSLPTLNVLLALVTGAWLLVSVVIVVDRARYDARKRRLQTTRQQLIERTKLIPWQIDDAARSVTGRLEPREFEQLALQGLPRDVETALAVDVQARVGSDLLRRRAEDEGGDVWRRISALQVLASSRHADAYPALERALRSGNPPLATGALRMLPGLDTREAAEVLVAVLRDEGYSRARVAAAFDSMTVSRADLLAPLFHASDPLARFWAARLAARLGATEWADTIRVMATDSQPAVRRAALEALGTLGTPQDRDLLLACFADPVPFVRTHAARAAAAFGDAEVATRLAGLLSDRQWMVRAAARYSLRRIGSIATEPLVTALWGADRFAANGASEVLFQTGAMTELARRVLDVPLTSSEAASVVQRFMAVAGAHLTQALLNQFTDRDRVTLVRYLADRTTNP